MLKPLKHSGNKEEQLAVLLKSGKKEFLLQIIKTVQTPHEILAIFNPPKMEIQDDHKRL